MNGLFTSPLRRILFLFFLSLIAFPLIATERPLLQGDGQIRIFNYHLAEFAEITFRRQEKPISSELQKINNLLRSRDNTEETEINLKLIDLLDHLQDHFGADTIEIISGYRSKGFNEALLKNGHGVSPVSWHTKGEAADIHIDEIREETLRDYLLQLKQCGVGYYGSFDFIHVDTGPFRRWGESGPFHRKLIGVLQETALIQLTSDKNDYLPGDALLFKWTLNGDVTLSHVQEIRLEHFFRGKWKPVSETVPLAIKMNFSLSYNEELFNKPNQTSRYGKYRWTFRISGIPDLQSSNEFYLKKL